MAFTPDPNAPGVIDLEKGYSLHPIVRDVPQDEEWFRFVFEGTQITAKSKRSWTEKRKVTFVFDAKQLAKGVLSSFLHRTPKYEPTPQEFSGIFLPALRDAVVTYVRSRIRLPDGRRVDVDVKFLE
jgi:hypothetical protein